MVRVPHRPIPGFSTRGAGFSANERWELMLDLQHRRVDFLKTTSQHVIRPGITYKPGSDFTLTIGHAFFWHNIGTESSVYRFEFRPFQFLQWSQSFSEFSLRHKVRLEQRFNCNMEQEQILDGFSYNHRAGYRIDIIYPFSEFIELDVYEEILINFGKAIRQEHLDQNRIHIGLRFKRNLFTYKVGYMWLVIPIEAYFDHLHTFRLGVSHVW